MTRRSSKFAVQQGSNEVLHVLHPRLRYPQSRQRCVGSWAPCLGPGGLVLRDFSGYGHHGTLQAFTVATDWVVSDGQYCLSIDASDTKYVSVSNTPVLTLTTEWSISMWARLLATPTHEDFLIGKAFSSSVVPYSIEIASGKITTSVFSGSSYRASSVTNAADVVGAWTHIVATRSQQTLSIAINGRIETSTTHAGMPIITNSGQFHIGRAGISSRQPTMEFDDVLLFASALTPLEINRLASRRGFSYESKRQRKYYFTGGTDTGSGSASLNFTAAAGGAADATGSGSASINFSGSAGGASDNKGTGSASLNFTAAAGGASEAVGSGSASLNFTASGVSILEGTGAGSASLNFTATAGGAAEAVGSGSASLNFTASAGGMSEVVGSGSASMSFSALGGGASEGGTTAVSRNRKLFMQSGLFA